MMDRKRHWAKLAAEEEWSDEARGETVQYMIMNIPGILDESWKTGGTEGKKGDVWGGGKGRGAVWCTGNSGLENLKVKFSMVM